MTEKLFGTMTPPILEARRSKSEAGLAIAAITIFLVVTLWSLSPIGALSAGIALIVAAVAVWPTYKRRISAAPPFMRLAESGVEWRGNTRRRLLPWSEIEYAALAYGGRLGPILKMRLRHPAAYLNRFERFNLMMSQFHISIRVGGLDIAPQELLAAIDSYRIQHVGRVSAA